jgi:phenylalanyl-tRNA synthetase beta chain
LPRYPSTSRDITLIVDETLESAEVTEAVLTMKEALVEAVHLFDVYQGKPVPPGRKSISFRITYRSPEQTLEDDRVNQLHQYLSDRLLSVFDATLPEGDRPSR